MQKWFFAAGVAALLAFATPDRAQAQTFLTPFAGVTFNGDAPANQFSTGVSVLFQGAAAGFEVELGYTPDFWKQSEDFVVTGSSNVTSLMGSLLVGIGEGQVRPYVIGGVGLLRSTIAGNTVFRDVSSNDFGVNAGFGLIGMFNDHVGLRGDFRYFRSVKDEDTSGGVNISLGGFDFWRAYVGVPIKF